MSDTKVFIVILLGVLTFTLIGAFISIFATDQGLNIVIILLLRLLITFIPSVIYVYVVLKYLKKRH